MRRRSILYLPAALAMFVLAAGCGGPSGAGNDGVASAAGNGGSAKNAKDAKASTDPQKAGLEFAQCMREHGVDVPDPTSDGGMVMIGPGPGSGSGTDSGPSFSGPPPGFEEADAACRHFLDGLIGDGGGPMDAAEQDRALKFAQCMREHGVDMPDPDFSGGGVRIKIGGDGAQIDRATVDAAQKACGSLFGPAGGAATARPGAGEVARS